MNIFTKGFNRLSGASQATDIDSDSDMSNRREHQRFKTDLVGNVQIDGTSRSSKISDISCGGLRLSDFGDVDVGEQIVVELDNERSVKGEIVWSANGDAGVKFEQAVESEDELLSKADGTNTEN